MPSRVLTEELARAEEQVSRLLPGKAVLRSIRRQTGHFAPAVFDTPDGRLTARHIGRETVTRVLDAHFATSVTGFRADDQQAAAWADRDGRLRRFTSNPLRGRPC